MTLMNENMQISAVMIFQKDVTFITNYKSEFPF